MDVNSDPLETSEVLCSEPWECRVVLSELGAVLLVDMGSSLLEHVEVLAVESSDPSEPFEVLSNFGLVLEVDLSSASLNSNVESSSPL